MNVTQLIVFNVNKSLMFKCICHRFLGLPAFSDALLSL